MNKTIITLIGICLYSICFAQKVEGLKKSSDKHNSGSGNQGSNDTKVSSSDNNSAADDCISGCISDACCSIFSGMIDNRHAKKAEEKRLAGESANSRSRGDTASQAFIKSEVPFEAMSFGIRGSFIPSGYHIWVPEIQEVKRIFRSQLVY